MSQASILNEFNEIEKNLELTKNPNNGDFAYSMVFNVEEFMMFYNALQQVCGKCNFKLVSITTHYDIGMLNVTITITDKASTIDRIKMRTFLDLLLKNDIIDFYN